MTGRVVELAVLRDDADDLIITGKYPGSNTTIAPCVCVQQAYSLAVRGRPRPGDLVVLRGRDGSLLADMPPCRVDQGSWVWEHHGHTHVDVEIQAVA